MLPLRLPPWFKMRSRTSLGTPYWLMYVPTVRRRSCMVMSLMPSLVRVRSMASPTLREAM